MTTMPNSIGGWSCDRVLGSGGFGIVELWVDARSGKKLAIKKCKWDTTQLTDIQQGRWIKEVLIMKQLNHPNIVKAINLPFNLPGANSGLPILCMEYCKKGDLRRILHKPENCCGINETEAIKVMKGISSAVEYLHSNNITHRDLKPENIVLQDEKDNTSYKLIDLGYAKDLGEASTSASIVGTLNYVAPELLWKRKYSCSVDYWSLGILFYELITGTRPFLPRMQHTITWMQCIKNKAADDICAFELDGEIVFGKDIVDPTPISRCLRSQLVEWFKVVLQWDPKKRGKQCENGTMQLVVFKMLKPIFSKKIVYAFSMYTYTINAYEVDESTSIIALKDLIAKDTDIPVHQQVLTDYFGTILTANEASLLSQTQDTILFLFNSKNLLVENIPKNDIPLQVQKMIASPRRQLDYDTLKDYYRITLFFIKQEVYLFQLYIFGLTITVDIVTTKVNMFKEQIGKALENTNALFNKLCSIRAKWEKEIVTADRKKALAINFEKVTKLVKATRQISLQFNPLIDESNELRKIAQDIDSINQMSDLYNKAVSIFEILNNDQSHKSAKPIEMVKLVFEFLKVREAQFNNESIREITRKILKLKKEISTLERIFDSVIAATIIYYDELKNITQCNFQDNVMNLPHDPSTSLQKNSSKILHNVATNQAPTDSYAMQVESSKLNSNQQSRTTAPGCSESMDTENDVIYDNLLIRHTLNNLLIQIKEEYMGLRSLDP